ncbi:MAG: hypothetical protein NVSMB26_21240 [Beijerinckiaceae bacterium]
MAFEISHVIRPVAGAAGVLVLVGLVSHAVPARAEEGNQTLRQIMGLITGDDGKKDTDGIDYRERPPLVLPPKIDLPPPQASAAEQNVAWPNDPDTGRVRKVKAESRAPSRHLNEVTANPHISQQELERGRVATTDSASGPLQNPCDNSTSPNCLYTPWSILKKVTGDADAKETLQPGVEPPREYLTQPPVGYRRPTQVVKATREAIKPEADASDPKAYIIEQNKRKHSVDD